MNKTTYYHYYNCNPQRKITDDCVIRAISAGTGETWESVLKGLVEYSIKTGYFINTPECYGKYLEDLGWKKQKQPIYNNGKKMKIKEFIDKFDGHAIAHAGRNHITYIADSSVWDLWNVEEQIIGNYWVPDSEVYKIKGR